MACRTGKQEYASRDEALAAQKHLVWLNHSRGHDERSAGLHTYPCPHCGAWHFGHTTPQIPLCYHYDTVDALDGDALAPAKRSRLPPRLRQRSRQLFALFLSLSERRPLLWFSWSPAWDPGSVWIPHPGTFVLRPAPPRLDEGIVRLAVPAYVAQLRWSDYVELNKATPGLHAPMRRLGNPADWLATDAPVPCAAFRSLDVWSDGGWRDVQDECATGG